MTTQTTAPVTRYRFTADQYEEMVRAGILTRDDRVELIDGEVVAMPPMGEGHSYSVYRKNRLFNRAFGDVAGVLVQAPIRLDTGAMPEPDIALLRLPDERYRSARPGPADIFLVVEVADTSLAYDRRTKARIYAQAGIPEYWVHNINQDILIVLRDPTQEGYRSVTQLGRGDRIALLAFPDRELAVSDLLGEPPAEELDSRAV